MIGFTAVDSESCLNFLKFNVDYVLENKSPLILTLEPKKKIWLLFSSLLLVFYVWFLAPENQCQSETTKTLANLIEISDILLNNYVLS